MTHHILAVSGSPSATSRTVRVTDRVLEMCAGPGVETRHLRAADLPAEALLRADRHAPGIREMIAAVEAADAIVIATPIFQAAYSGLLKAFLDVLPQFAFAGKAVLPLATGGSLAHVLALDYGLRPVLQSMGARHIVQSYFVPEQHMHVTDGRFDLDAASIAPLEEAVYHLKISLGLVPTDVLLGHPRPQRPRASA
jgi:FMN reductase